jgi:hypothetical protein
MRRVAAGRHGAVDVVAVGMLDGDVTLLSWV